VLEEPDDIHLPAKLLLQWLCQDSSSPCPTVIFAATHLAGADFPHTMIRIRHASASAQGADGTIYRFERIRKGRTPRCQIALCGEARSNVPMLLDTNQPFRPLPDVSQG
jgi:hypothetical protein